MYECYEVVKNSKNLLLTEFEDIVLIRISYVNYKSNQFWYINMNVQKKLITTNIFRNERTILLLP